MVCIAGFAADMFGADVERGASLPIERRIELTSSLLGGDGEAGLARMRAAFEAVTTDESLADIVDVENIAAIGYCFGGSSVMEFLRVAPEGLKGRQCLSGRQRNWMEICIVQESDVSPVLCRNCLLPWWKVGCR